MSGVKSILLVLLCGVMFSAGGAAAEMLDDFEQGLGEDWKPKFFQGKTDYRVVADGADGGFCLQADCDNSASGLVLTREYRLQDTPWLSWRWKVSNVHEAGNARQKSGDDYAARIYVVFPHWFFPKTRTLNYIWANRVERETFLVSPYTANSMMIALQSGSDAAGKWRLEKRNVLEDYRKAFGEEPPAVGAIAIMTDADNTGGQVTAWYDDISISAE